MVEPVTGIKLIAFALPALHRYRQRRSNDRAIEMIGSNW